MVNAGRILILAQGEWDNLTNYVPLDLVSKGETAYLARKASVGIDPETDVEMFYWQPFGSVAKIATTEIPGLVMPDGTTLTIDSTGLLKAEIGVSELTDVLITNLANGSFLRYDAETQKWKNVTLGTASSKNSTNAVTQGSSDLVESGAVYTKVNTINGELSEKINNETKTRGELGAKNIYNHKGQNTTVDGMNYTVNSDRTITASGTLTARSAYLLSDGWSDKDVSWIKKYEGQRVIISGSVNDFIFSMTFKDENNNILLSLNTDYQGGEGSAVIPSGIDNYVAYFYPSNLVTLSDAIFKPMIRLATDSDSTYVQFSKTNQELTREIESFLGISENDSDWVNDSFGQNTFIYYIRKNNVVNISLAWWDTGSAIADSDTIYTLPAKYRPSIPIFGVNAYINQSSNIRIDTDGRIIVETNNASGVIDYGRAFFSYLIV